VPHTGQGMEDYRLPGSRVNPKNYNGPAKS
jgi:hypothetical protein